MEEDMKQKMGGGKYGRLAETIENFLGASEENQMSTKEMGAFFIAMTVSMLAADNLNDRKLREILDDMEKNVKRIRGNVKNS